MRRTGFATVLKGLRRGKAYRRASWVMPDVYIELVPRAERRGAYICAKPMDKASPVMVPPAWWNPSQNDLLANDWIGVKPTDDGK